MEKAPPPSSILHPPSSFPAPLPLAYDDLPPGSDIRREYDAGDAGALSGGRGVKIVVPAGEPPPAVRKILLFDSFASGARASWALLLLSFLLFSMGLRNNRISGVALGWAWLFFGIFCGALVLLVAWVRYGVVLDAIRIGREQMTALAATRARLLIETAGPFGIASYDFPREKISSITVRRGVLRDDRNLPRRLLHLSIALADGRTILVLPGRDPRELQWIAAAVNKALGLS
jgi:hypothetical protein